MPENRIKLICIEEHTIDKPIFEAAKSAQSAEAPYRSAIKTETPIDESATHPQHVFYFKAIKLAEDIVNERLAAMDKHGIDMQILSYANATQLIPKQDALNLARAANTRMSEIIAQHPARFGGFATLPWNTPQEAVTELERAVRDLNLCGTLLLGRPGETFLDDPIYDAVLAKHAELQVPIYVHPGPPLPQVQQPYYGNLQEEVSALLSLSGWGWHNEAGIQVIRMILAGCFDRHQNLQVISGHWGEMVPFYLHRLDDVISQKVTGLSRTITQTYKEHVYVTPAGMFQMPHFEFIYKIMGAERILFSNDYPFLTLNGTRDYLESLPISPSEKVLIANGNVKLLFDKARRSLS